jgi:hypothetical protein
MDGGIIDGWWREVGDDGDEDLLQIPVLTGCQNRVSGSESRFLMVAAHRKSIWEKCQTPDSFRLKGICRRKGGLEEAAGVVSPSPGTARPGPRPWWWACLPAPLRLVFWLRGSSGKIGILQYFLGFFLKVGFLHKNKTLGKFCWK